MTLQILRSVLQILEQSYFLHTPRQCSSLFKKKKKIGEAFQSDHFLKRMLSSNIRFILWLGGDTPCQGQGRRLGGATPCPRSSGCTGTGRPTGAIPRSRSGGAAKSRYPSSKLRSSGCALLGWP